MSRAKFYQYVALGVQALLTLTCLTIVLTRSITSSFGNFFWSLQRVVGVLLFLPSFALWFLARLELTRNAAFSPWSDTEPPRLVTTGVYSHLRHPIYTFSFLFMLGFFLLADNKQGLVMMILVGLPVQCYRASREDDLLRARFGHLHTQWVEQ